MTHIKKIDEMNHKILTENHNQNLSESDKIVKILQLMHNSEFRITKGFSEIETIPILCGDGTSFKFSCGETAQDGSGLLMSCDNSEYKPFDEYETYTQSDAYYFLCDMVTNKLATIIDGLNLNLK